MYTSFKLIAVIDKPYRQWINNLLHKGPQSLGADEFKIHKYINHLYFNNGGFFKVEKEYSEYTGILICGGRLKNQGHNLGDDSNGDEIEFCIKNSILPFGKIKEYYTHEDDMCCDCTCTPQNEFNFACDKKAYYLNKYKAIIEKNQEDTSSKLKDKMKGLLKKDIESILDRYVNYNFDLTELKTSLESL
jgi:hypothetical protein